MPALGKELGAWWAVLQILSMFSCPTSPHPKSLYHLTRESEFGAHVFLSEHPSPDTMPLYPTTPHFASRQKLAELERIEFEQSNTRLKSERMNAAKLRAKQYEDEAERLEAELQVGGASSE